MTGILSWMVFLPLIGGIVILFLKQEQKTAIRWAASIFSFIPLVLSFIMLAQYRPSDPSMQFVELAKWIPPLNVHYHVGVDGISVPMLFLTALLSFISIVASFGIEKRLKEYFAFFLLLETGMMGVFAALDFFLFYVFWEVMLVPMYFLIGVWGGPRKEYAAIKFFLYTLFGSIFMLVGILLLYFNTTPHTLSFLELIEHGPAFSHGLQILVFAFFFVAFAIKIPAWPFHTWLPDAHVEAPTAVSVILAGVLLKMGTYGLLRISFPMLPYGTQYFIWPMAIIGVIGIIYGALVCMAQKDLKKLVAYSSVSHMGYTLLGMAAIGGVAGIQGCLFQMFSHGLITGALFLLVGVLYDRAHTREIDVFGGLWLRLPVYSGVMVLFVMGSLGLPGLSGFVAEFMVFIGSFPTFTWLTGLAVFGVVLTAAYFLRMVQKMFLGEFNTRWEGKLPDMKFREIFTVVPLGILMIAIGVWPRLLSDWMQPTIEHLVTLINR